MANKADNTKSSADRQPERPSGAAASRKDISPKTAARPQMPTKPASTLREEQLLKHNPARGTPSIRRNPEAGKPKEQRTNRGAKLPHDAPSSPNTSKNPPKRAS